MKLPGMLALSAIAFAALFIGFLLLSPRHRDESVADVASAPLWQRMAAPGELSQPHAFLENNCAACHTSVKGVEASNCVVCHADNKTILERQPSAFHADIGECSACHLEHQGRVTRTTQMDHVALARIGLRQARSSRGAHGEDHKALVAWVMQDAVGAAAPTNPQLHREEALLNCAACHQTKDRHRGFFGNDCSECHGTAKWTIEDYRHPSPASQSCVQCHQAPPSHYMMHFKMISMKIAGMEHAEVNQCFLCHQTTSWNDIRGVGFYKHH